MAEVFYESGYNCLPWTNSSHASTDIFYFDLSQELVYGEDLLTELKVAANGIFKKDSVLLDDGSLEAEILKRLTPQSESVMIQTWPVDFPTNTDASIRWRKNRLVDPELHLLLQFAKYINKPLIVPRAWSRVINANWSPNKMKTYGLPYWVYTENERYHCMQVIQQAEHLDIEANILKWSPQIYRSYFLNPQLTNFFLSTQNNTADNYGVERQILYGICKDLGGNTSVDLHKRHWRVPEKLLDLLPSLDMQQACFPLHVFYKKYLRSNLAVNLFESKFYGQAL